MRPFVATALLLLTLVARADGPVTVAPSSDPLATWQLVGIRVSPASPATVAITIVWLTQGGRAANLDTDLYPLEIVLTGAEITGFLGAVSPASTDSFSGTANSAKRFRQRASKWLIDNGKISRGGNES